MVGCMRELRRFTRVLKQFTVLAFSCAVASFTGLAAAQAFPSKPIKFIVPFAPGGGNDLLARITGQKLSESMGVPVVVENRIGASGIIGNQFVIRSPADGYTIVIGGTPLTVNQTLQKDIPYDALKDFTPISLMVLQPNVLIVNPQVPAQNLRELIALAKAQPGKLNYGVGSEGSAPHLAAELLKVMGGLDVVHVPYNGNAPMMNAVITGEVTFGFDQPATALSFIQAGKVRALGVTGTSRSSQLPNVPTIAEAGLPGYEINSWFGILGPPNMPKAVTDRLSAEFAKALNSPEVRERLTSQGFTVVGSTPEQFAAHLKADVANWKCIIEAAKMTIK